jgi:heat shock protein HslJ
MRALLALSLILAACVQAGPEDKAYVWKLVAIDGRTFVARATLVIEGDRAHGEAPCNTWSGDIEKEPFPEWRIRNVTATEMACDNLAAEADFFAAMAAMTHSSVGIGYLELVDQHGRKMSFVPLNP